jgi:hypothetical protein
MELSNKKSNSNNQMATIAQLYTDMKHKNAKEVLPHFFDILKIS